MFSSLFLSKERGHLIYLFLSDSKKKNFQFTIHPLFEMKMGISMSFSALPVKITWNFSSFSKKRTSESNFRVSFWFARE